MIWLPLQHSSLDDIWAVIKSLGYLFVIPFWQQKQKKTKCKWERPDFESAALKHNLSKDDLHWRISVNWEDAGFCWSS